MSLYAANNIAKGICRFAGRGKARLGGIIGNSRNTVNEEKLLKEFAARLNTNLIAFIPRDIIVNQAENKRQTVIEFAPTSNQAEVYRRLAEDIENNQKLTVPTPMTFEELEELISKYAD